MMIRTHTAAVTIPTTAILGERLLHNKKMDAARWWAGCDIDVALLATTCCRKYVVVVVPFLVLADASSRLDCSSSTMSTMRLFTRILGSVVCCCFSLFLIYHLDFFSCFLFGYVLNLPK